jgi:CSLREA domain-containing protein
MGRLRLGRADHRSGAPFLTGRPRRAIVPVVGRSRGSSRYTGLLVAMVSIACALASSARAATLVVNTTADDTTSGDGHCSLRKAIQSVDTPGTPSPDCVTPSATGNTIELAASNAPGATGPVLYTLTVHPTGPDDDASGDLNISGSVVNLTLEGPGAGQASIDASTLNDRVLTIAAGASVTLTGVTITGGHAPAGASDTTADAKSGGSGSPGGGILNQGTLALTGVDVTGNFAGAGGTGGGGFGILVGGTGGAGGDGGGIDNTGSLTVTGGEISGNQAGAGGSGGPTTVSEPAGTGGAGGGGGGIASTGMLVVSGSDVSTNLAGAGGDGGKPQLGVPGGGGGSGGAGGAGGGILSAIGSVTVTGTTVDANSAGAGGHGQDAGTNGGTSGTAGAGGCGGDGGGIDAPTGVTISASTINANHAGGGGSGGAGGFVAGTTAGNGGDGCAGGNGGGVAAPLSPLSLTDTTLTANFAGAGGNGGNGGGTDSGTGGKGGDAGAGGNGGGQYDGALGASTTLASTIFQNGAGAAGAAGSGGQPESGGTAGAAGAAGTAGAGGGIFVRPQTPCPAPLGCPRVSLTDAIVASDAGSNCSGSVLDGGNDLSFGDATCPGITGDPKLDMLADNGGPVQTSDLGSGSAAIDAGPASGPNCPATDARGVARPFGKACDIGAYEVTPPATGTGSASSVTGTSATVTATVTANAGEATVTVAFGTTTAYGSTAAAGQVAGLAPASVSADLTGLEPGTTYHYQVVATSTDGTSRGADATFTTTSPAAPAVTMLRVSPSTFAPARSGASIPARKPSPGKTGTTVSYKDSAAATTTFTIVYVVAGVRSGRRCVAPPRHRASGRKLRACKRSLAIGHFTHTDLAGANAFHFTGRLRRHALRAGRYRLSAVPRAGRLSGRPVTAGFRIRT